jgi:hypothetical protein
VGVIQNGEIYIENWNWLFKDIGFQKGSIINIMVFGDSNFVRLYLDEKNDFKNFTPC